VLYTIFIGTCKATTPTETDSTYL